MREHTRLRQIGKLVAVVWRDIRPTVRGYLSPSASPHVIPA